MYNLTVVGTDSVYNNITQPNAATASRNMYTSDKFTSDLVNSYAWDTAIVFAQTFDDRTDKTTPYSKQSNLVKTYNGSGYNGFVATTGSNNLTDTSMQDRICNIWDMASNYGEWSTETSSLYASNFKFPEVLRGGYFNGGNSFYTSSRNTIWEASGDSTGHSFRPILYL